MRSTKYVINIYLLHTIGHIWIIGGMNPKRIVLRQNGVSKVKENHTLLILVISYACIIVWQIEHDNSEKMKKQKEFLVKLSGRLIQRGKEATSPALLAGLWSFFSMLDIFETHDMHELYSIRETLTDLMEIPL